MARAKPTALEDQLDALLSTKVCLCADACVCRSKLPISRQHFAEVFTVVHSGSDGGKVGEGSFGKVWRCSRKRSQSHEPAVVAVKEVAKVLGTASRAQRLRQIVAEVVALSLLKHPNIVHLHEVLHDDRAVYMVMEYCETGSLYDYLSASWGKSTTGPPVDTAAVVLKQIFCALHFMHEHMFVHRDVKSENCLYDCATQHVKLIDFGLAKYCSNEPLPSSPCAAVDFSSPLVCCTPGAGTESHLPFESITDRLNGDRVRTTRGRLGKMDVYGAGCIAYIMLVGQLPYRVKTGHTPRKRLEALRALMRKGLQIPAAADERLTAAMRELLHSTLQTESDLRASAAEALLNDWLAAASTGGGSAGLLQPPPRCRRATRAESEEAVGAVSAEAMAAAVAHAAAAAATAQLASLTAEQRRRQAAGGEGEAGVVKDKAGEEGMRRAADWTDDAAYDTIRLAEDDDLQEADLAAC
eukprot:TRINITY_DN673_c0_g1_i1.p1 TRINITY_DN673_c0_g1~~TRINITY_DN673_c0_g1_i1.p1  ORF type:complete len:493 (+),score=93.25 TRINITY_DN673_c0_g1_i1:78-1481(+)